MNIVQYCGIVNTTLLANRELKFISIHYTAGTSSKAGTAMGLAKWYKQGAGGREVSSDFVIDDETIVQYNADIKNRYTWCIGGSKYMKMSTSLGGRMYGIAKNSNTINIEICNCKTNPKSLNADDNDWYFTAESLSNAVELVRYLMTEYKIPAENVIMHHEVTGKLCPAMWTHSESDLSGWYDFKKRIGTGITISKTDEKPKELYRVQVGAFASEANAQSFLRDVKQHYPGAFITKS